MATAMQQERRKALKGYVPDKDRLDAIRAKHKKLFDQIDKDNMP